MANEKHRFLTGSRRWTIDKTVVDGITAAIMNALAVSYASITNGVLAASKVMTLDATGSAVMPSGGMFALSRASIAAAGTNQATAAALTAQVNAITASDGTKGVALPAAATTTGPIFVVNTVNTTAALLKIYPVNSGDDNINGLAANLAFFALPGQTLMFIPVSATQWYVEDLSALPAAPLKSQGAANALNSSGTLTAAMMVGGIVTSTTGAAVTATLDTGTAAGNRARRALPGAQGRPHGRVQRDQHGRRQRHHLGYGGRLDRWRRPIHCRCGQHVRPLRCTPHRGKRLHRLQAFLVACNTVLRVHATPCYA
jgi:hypothetical protein